MEIDQEPCAFAHSCCNPGPRLRLPGTALFFCGPHAQLATLPRGAGTSADELGGSRSYLAAPRRSPHRGWDLGVAASGSWL
jgi:hypothetical protein